MNSSEMRALGRIGQPLSGGTYRPRRRLRATRWLVICAVCALLAAAWVAVAANRQVGATPDGRQVGAAAGDTTVAHAPPRPVGSGTSRTAARTQTQPLATVEGLELSVPHPSPLAVAFHEASRPEALAMQPVGRLVANRNASFEPPADTAGTDYHVLPSRGRARPATSAVDVVVPVNEAVSAPVTGTVTGVTQYPLYGRVRDWRVEITPKGRPDLTVVLVHLLRPGVGVGDTVTAGQTELAVVRLLPYDSDVDAVLDERQPHAHLEVKPAVEPEPIDPNQPALPADDADL